MFHMYHEIQQPYEFLWRLRPSLAATGEVIVVDADRVPQNHGMPPKLLECEFAAVGYKLVEMREMPSAGGYPAAFRAVGPRPEPEAITPCRLQPRSRCARNGGGIATTGKASCGERVCQYVSISGGAVSYKKKKNTKPT